MDKNWKIIDIMWSLSMFSTWDVPGSGLWGISQWDSECCILVAVETGSLAYFEAFGASLKAVTSGSSLRPNRKQSQLNETKKIILADAPHSTYEQTIKFHLPKQTIISNLIKSNVQIILRRHP